jgi:hypothetical protein
VENYRILMEDTKNKIEKKKRQYIMQTETNDAIIKFRDDLQVFISQFGNSIGVRVTERQEFPDALQLLLVTDDDRAYTSLLRIRSAGEDSYFQYPLIVDVFPWEDIVRCESIHQFKHILWEIVQKEDFMQKVLEFTTNPEND